MNATEAQNHLDELVRLTEGVPKLKGVPTRSAALASEEREWRIVCDEFLHLRSQLAQEMRKKSEAELTLVEELAEKLKAVDDVLNSHDAKRVNALAQEIKQKRARAMAEAAKSSRQKAAREKAIADVIAWLTA